MGRCLFALDARSASAAPEMKVRRRVAVRALEPAAPEQIHPAPPRRHHRHRNRSRSRQAQLMCSLEIDVASFQESASD